MKFSNALQKSNAMEISDNSSVCNLFIDFSETLVVHKINFSTYPSGNEKLRFGGIFDNQSFFSQWEPSFMKNCKPSIEFLELYALAVAIILWAEQLQNR